MSSTNPFPSPTVSSPAATNTSSNNDNGPPGSNSLYLFTFLTTLLLLLAVSLGIIIRSFVLRRRFRRRVEAAIAAGVLLPEQVEALRRRGPAIGEKPKLWEVYIDGGHKTGYEDSGSASRNDGKAADDWSGIMPISAMIIPGKTSSHISEVPAPAVPQFQRFSARPANPRRALWWLRGPDTNPTQLSPILPITAPPPPPPEQNYQSQYMPPFTNPANTNSNANTDDKLQLTVLIAMPNRNARASTSPSSIKGKERDSAALDDEEEGEIPEVVFGVTEVPWTGGAEWIPALSERKDENGEGPLSS